MSSHVSLGAGETTRMDIAEQVSLAVRNCGNFRLEVTDDEQGTGSHGVIPSRLGYALGWIVANLIVSARYRDSAIDAIPVYHPEQGWDRFLLTRRLSCTWHEGEQADSVGLITLTGEDAPYLQLTGGPKLALGSRLQRDAIETSRLVLDSLRPLGLADGDHSRCWHERAKFYPTLYGVVTELILEDPDLVAAREIFVDDQQLDGTYHPLYLHGVVSQPQMVYDWFELSSSEETTFFAIDGEYAIYRTDSGGWSSVRRQLVKEDRDRIKSRVLAWLRVVGGPDPKID